VYPELGRVGQGGTLYATQYTPEWYMDGGIPSSFPAQTPS